MFDSQLQFDENTDCIVKRGHQRIHPLRKLDSSAVSKNILCSCYLTFIKSLLTFSFVRWLGGLSVKDRDCLFNIVKVCSEITGAQRNDLCSLWRRKQRE